MTNKGKYINFNGKQVQYGYNTELSLSQKVNFIMEVACMVVSSEIGYAYILKETIFNYCLIKYYTDIVIFEKDDEFSIDKIDQFNKDNKEIVIDIIRQGIGEDIFSELTKACDEAINFRKENFNNFKEEVTDLLQVVREYVVKPDYLNELLVALTNAVNIFADKGDIDMDAVNKLVDIIPLMNNMESKEVAKTIIEEHHKGSEKTKEGSTSKAIGYNKKNKSDSNIKVVK